MTALDAGIPPGGLGVRYPPVWSAFMLSEPKAGGTRAAFLLTSSLRMAPPSAVWMTPMEVSPLKSKSFGGAMLYSSAEALAAGCHHADDKRKG